MKISSLHPKAFLIAKVYYWNCRLNTMTALIAGPFATAELAEACADYVSPIVVAEKPECRKASFGVVQMNAPGNGPGHYNQYLPQHLMGELLLDTGYREGDQRPN
jgi:hypothetical protein